MSHTAAATADCVFVIVIQHMTEEASAEEAEKLPTCESVEIQAVEESATAIQIVIL